MKGRYALLRDQTPEFRRAFQLDRWVEGQSIHNDLENECVPDFSCCQSKVRLRRRLRVMFARDLASRHSIIQSVIYELTEKDPRFLAQCDIPGLELEYYVMEFGSTH